MDWIGLGGVGWVVGKLCGFSNGIPITLCCVGGRMKSFVFVIVNEKDREGTKAFSFLRPPL